jgi:hypothetical protein
MARRIVIVLSVWLAATFAVMAVVGVLGSSNIVWGEDDQYGTVDVPGAKVLHLPKRTVDVSAAVFILGKGNETVDLPLPSDMALRVAPVDGGAQPVVSRDVGGSANAGSHDVNTQRRVWKVDVPADGDYRVSAAGDLGRDGVNPQVWFGHGPPIPGTFVPFIAAIVTTVAGLVRFVLLPRLRRRREPA